MLDTETKRRIDTARDILVGKVPDPKSQVEQITIALIYKFMDDMDAEAEELGGKRKFFIGDFARYGWAKLMRSGLGGHETLALYGEGITKMTENASLPPLFRDIFKNAYLPYRDPETLKAFLRIIDSFTYDHSERLGDAFEYLLSVLGSQGDAGQFRTPRHIIDFIVSIVDPKKDETILDPACGTAGFLISSYKHILRANTNKKGHSTLTPDDRGRLARNFKGYDISPDMVRLSLVNMYLHGFTDPHLYEYDTLTSEERWNEFSDVILANPPFMSPKGGIKPHRRFSVQSKRSEVLFVDYIAEHLTPAGRAGVIVPEGIIFKSQTSYKTLRKMLVENHLVAVISLPSGLFQPYSGVKTSILIFDRSLAHQSDTIGFFKVENDGFGLGAQRRPIDKNDLPQVKAELETFLQTLRAHPVQSPAGPTPAIESKPLTTGLIVPKEKIAANGDYNLSGERYGEAIATVRTFPFVRIDEACDINPDAANPSDLYPKSVFNYIDISCVENDSGKFIGANQISVDEAPSRARRSVKRNDILLSTVRPNLKAFTILNDPPERAIASTGFAVLRTRPQRLLPQFLIHVLRHDRAVEQMVGLSGRGAYPSINQSDVASIRIPLPPLGIQEEIVTEIEGYQKVIDGARAVLDNYRPYIPIHPDWPTKELGEVCRLGRGFAFKSEDYVSEGVLSFRVSNIGKDRRPDLDNSVFLPPDFLKTYAEYQLQEGDFVIVMVGATTGKIGYITSDILPALLNQNMWRFHPDESVLNKSFLYYAIDQLPLFRQGGARDYLRQSDFLTNPISLPPLTTQQNIVAEIEAEQALVAANRELITRMEKKIQATLARVWGEEEIGKALPTVEETCGEGVDLLVAESEANYST